MSQGTPSAQQLLLGVLRYLEADLVPTLSGAQAYETRVAVHVLGIVARELAAPASDGSDDTALAAAIRDGSVDGRDRAVLAQLRAAALARLAMDNPRYHHVLRSDDTIGP